MPKEKKSILVIIIILLVISLPLGMLGLYLNLTSVKDNSDKTNDTPSNIINQTPTDTNYADGKLSFYDDNKKLIGTYTCEQDPCSYATSLIDDSNYAIEYLKNDSASMKVVSNRYIFINDKNEIKLYDITESKVIETYKAVKNYNNMMNPDTFIVQNKEDKWGVIKLETSIENILDFKYDFIGLINKLTADNLLNSENFVVKKDSVWFIVDNEDDASSNPLTNEITSYNDVLISVKSNNLYYLYDYYGQRKIDTNGFNYVSFTNKYINIVDKNNNLYVLDFINDKKISQDIKLNGNNYAQAFTSVYNSDNNTITLTVNGKTYNLGV